MIVLKPECKQSESDQVGLNAYPLVDRTPLLKKSVGWRPGTIRDRTKAVERVILAMREQPSHPFSLQELADIAVMSPYHFDRVFRDIVGVTPRLFLSALRLEAAKRLLLTTSLKVIDICYEVGYDSLGTFTTRFTDFVGVQPTSLRQMHESGEFSAIASQFDKQLPLSGPMPRNAEMTGFIKAPEDFRGMIFIGLFESPIPQTPPIACDIKMTSGEYRMGPVPNGQYYMMAAALDAADDPLTALLSAKPLRTKTGPVLVQQGAVSGPIDLTLRDMRLTDPPIVLALPLLLVQRQAAPFCRDRRHIRIIRS